VHQFGIINSVLDTYFISLYLLEGANSTTFRIIGLRPIRNLTGCLEYILFLYRGLAVYRIEN